MKTIKKAANKIIISVENFSKMTSSEVVKLMESNKSFAIIGEKVGIDRHIVERTNF